MPGIAKQHNSVTMQLGAADVAPKDGCLLTSDLLNRLMDPDLRDGRVGGDEVCGQSRIVPTAEGEKVWHRWRCML